MSEKKLDNAEYKVKRTDGNVLSGDSNKIKLKITSYAIIMEVQEAYMQEEIKEEIKAQEEKQKELEQKLENDNLSFKEKREIKKELSFISEELNIRNEIYAEFSKSRKRFLELAKKALKLPEENLKQLGETGWLEIEGEKVNIDKEYEDIQNKLMDAQDNEIVFTNVDTDAIKEEVERAMGEKDKEVPSEYANNGDFISQHITADNFDESVHAAAEDIKEAVDDKKTEEITDKDLDDLFENVRALSTEEPKATKEEPTIEFNPFKPKDTKTESPTIDFNVPPIASETGEWTIPQPTNDNKSFAGFDNDKSIESFIKGLEDRNASLKSHGEELNSKISEVKAERTEATNKQEQAKREREEAKKRKDEVKRQIELFNSYKPKMDELRKANEEQEKLNSDKEAELKKENEALAAINSETTTIETETAAYDEETSKALEELKKLRAEFAGTGYDSGDTQMTSGGRTM